MLNKDLNNNTVIAGNKLEDLSSNNFFLVLNRCTRKNVILISKNIDKINKLKGQVNQKGRELIDNEIRKIVIDLYPNLLKKYDSITCKLLNESCYDLYINSDFVKTIADGDIVSLFDNNKNWNVRITGHFHKSEVVDGSEFFTIVEDGTYQIISFNQLLKNYLKKHGIYGFGEVFLECYFSSSKNNDIKKKLFNQESYLNYKQIYYKTSDKVAKFERKLERKLKKI